MEDIQDPQGFIVKESNDRTAPQKIKVIGVGGGGGNAIKHMYELGVNNVTFIIANTDKQALDNSPVPTKVLLGPNVTRGRGAGNVPDVARKAAEESEEELKALFDKDTDMVFITAGMGGGTGTGAAPVISRISKEQGILTIGIVTIPFLFEGQKKIIKAVQGADEMRKYVDALLIINNERLSDIYSDYDFINAFGKADDVLSMAAMSISEIVTCNGYINLDFNDVDHTLRNGGTAIIATGYGEGENRVGKAIQDALNSPLLKNTDIFTSRRLLFNLYFSPNADATFKTEETKQITSFISNIDPNVDIIWGLAFDDTLGDKVKFTILAAGFDVSLSNDEFFPGVNSPQEATSDGPKTESDEDKVMTVIYGPEKVEEMKQKHLESRCRVLKPDQFDDDNAISEFNDRPAYDRSKQPVLASETKTSEPTAPAKGTTIDFSDIN